MERSRSVQTLLYALLLGSFFFTLNNAAVIAAAIAPVAGCVPQYFIRNTDTPTYLNGMQLSGSGLLLPNYFSPWRVPNAIFTPVMWTAGRITAALPWSLTVRYHLVHFVAYVIASAALIVMFRHFLPTGWQRIAAALVVVCSVPWFSIGYAVTRILGRSPGLFSLGPVQATYITADGLARGGTSNSITLTFGTLTVLAAVFFLAKRMETGKAAWIWAAAGVNFLSALFHPFEFLPITITGFVLLALEAHREHRWRRAIQEGAILGVPALIGVMPYLVLLANFAWLRDARPGLKADFNPASVILMFGPPAFLSVYLLLLRFRPETRSDQVLAVWCVVCLGLLLLKTSSPFHIVDGYVYVNAALAIRLLSTAKAKGVLAKHRRAAMAAAAICVILCFSAQAFTFDQLIRDGRTDNPDLLLSAVVPRGEIAAREWLHSNAQPDDVVLAPGVAAAWMATIPIHTLAAQEDFSISFDKQCERSRLFFGGQMAPAEAENFEREYGIRWIMMPASSPASRYFTDEKPVLWNQGMALYARPQNQIRDYAPLQVLARSSSN